MRNFFSVLALFCFAAFATPAFASDDHPAVAVETCISGHKVVLEGVRVAYDSKAVIPTVFKRNKYGKHKPYRSSTAKKNRKIAKKWCRKNCSVR